MALLAGILTSIPSAFAYELPEHYSPTRPLGMGNAFTAVANDENSAWSNPAGFSRVRKARSKETFHSARFPNLSFGANTSARSFYNDISSQEDAISELITEKAEEIGDAQTMWIGTTAFPYAAIEFNQVPVMLGFYNYTRGSIVIDTATPESAEIDAVSDIGAILTVAVPSKSNLFSTGFTVRTLGRYSYDDIVPSDSLSSRTTLQTNFEELSNQTSAVALDLGMIATFPDFWFPTFGISILNVPLGCRDNYLNPISKQREKMCGTVFTGDILNENSMSLVDPTDIRAGFSITARFARQTSLRMAFDAHHIPLSSGDNNYGLKGIDPIKMFHAGAELFFANPLSTSPISLRAGVNQGFVTAGGSIAGGILALDFASYGVDVSSSAKQIEDRRWLATVSLLF
jgi:hypothetical protein